jgi:hypothetical protein
MRLTASPDTTPELSIGARPEPVKRHKLRERIACLFEPHNPHDPLAFRSANVDRAQLARPKRKTRAM